MRGASYITAWQFTFFRIVFGLFLTWHFQKMALTGVGGSAYGLKFEALNAPVINILTRLLDADASTIGFIVFIGFGLLLSIVYTLGFARRVIAILLLFVWGGVWGNQIIDGIFCSPFYISLLLLLSACISAGEPFSFKGRENLDWFLPKWMYWLAWALLSIGYGFNGILKLQNEAWMSGSWMATEGLLVILAKSFAWGIAVFSVAFSVFSFFKQGRYWAWLCMLVVQIVLGISQGGAHWTGGVVMIHLFLFDPSWFKAEKDGRLRIIFYDGECGLCNRTVYFLMGIDSWEMLRFAPLQGNTAAEILPAGLVDITQLDTLVYAVSEHGKLVTTEVRSNAVLAALKEVGGIGRLMALWIWIPRPVRDWTYRMIAKNRLRFWKKETCRLPTPEERKRLLP